MKKILLIFLLTPLISFAQVMHWDASTGTVVVSTTNPVPTQAIENTFEVSDSSFAVRDTNGTTNDTLSQQVRDGQTSLTTTYSKWFQVCIATDDTIIVSNSASFPATNSWYIYGSESWTSEKINADKTTNLFYKSSSTGTAYVRIRIWGY